MKNQRIKSTLLIMLLLSFITYSFGQKNINKINIPFDSITQKYTYVKIIETPNKSEEQLYKLAKKWTKLKFADEKYLIDNENIQLTDLGNFSFVYQYKKGFPIPYTIIYNLNFLFKNGKYKLEISNIKLSQNSQGTTAEYSIEAFKKQPEGIKMGRKIAEQVVFEVMNEIDLNLLKVIAEIESAIINESKTNTDW